MKYYPIAIIVILVVLLPIYMREEKRSNFVRATTFKLIVSGLCSLCALLGLFLANEASIDERIPVIVALVCAIFGDYFLQYIRLDSKKFNIGIGCFSLTQISLIAFLVIRDGLSWPEFVSTAVISLGVLILMIAQKWNLGSAKIPLSIYTVLLAFMSSKAVIALFGAVVTPSMCFMAAGAVLFLLSDLLLGIWNFKTGKRAYANLNWITYFCGILLIALSVSTLPDLI